MTFSFLAAWHRWRIWRRVNPETDTIHISDWRLSEPENIDQLLEKLKQGDIKFAFLYTAALDGLLHMKLKDKAAVRKKLEWYSGKSKL